MSMYDVRMTFHVDDPGVTPDDVELIADELKAEAERRPGWFVDIEEVRKLD